MIVRSFVNGNYITLRDTLITAKAWQYVYRQKVRLQAVIASEATRP
jgi:hypothetical protein